MYGKFEAGLLLLLLLLSSSQNKACGLIHQHFLVEKYRNMCVLLYYIVCSIFRQTQFMIVG